jgi:hypothetical protein
VVPATFQRSLTFVTWLLVATLASAETKSIRLRNHTIVTRPPDPAAARLHADLPPATGLFLIQFVSQPSPDLRLRLRDRGVDLLRYVPDDAFVARFESVNLSELRALPEVQFVSPYQPDYKIAAALRALVAAGEALDVSIALTPDGTPVQRIALRRDLQRLERESNSRFGTILRGRVTPAQLAVLARSGLVLWIEPAPRMRMYDEIASKIVGGGSYETAEPGEGFPPIGGGDDDDDIFVTAAVRLHSSQPQSLPGPEHLTLTQQLGFDGTGVTVSVADSGLHNGDAESMHPDLAGRVDAFFAYGTLTDAADEHSHGTHVAGIVAGNGATGETDGFGNLYGLGVAPGARLIAQRIFDGIGNYEAPPTFETLTRDAVRAGAQIGSNSWGDDTHGRYDLSAAEFDALVRDADELAAGDQPYILEFSAGNAGPGAQTIGSPAVAKNVIASGAAQNDRYGFFLFEDGPEAMADFSSRGPCDDGRIKPDVVAPGTWIASLQSDSATDEFAWAAISANYQYQGGTSQSGPHVSGAAAVFVQFWRETQSGLPPSPALVKAALINSATDMDDDLGGTDPIPNMDEGWGRVTLTNLIGSDRKFDFVDQSVALTHLQVFERSILVGNPRTALKVTLAYTDVPGLPAAVPALVNDLDLEVLGPDGTVYRGNAFDLGESIPNALAADPVNNVEGVHLQAPQPGEYLVRVRGTRVVEDVFRRDNVNPAQDFALVTSGDLPLPGEGIVALDRAAYSVPATVQIKLIDQDLRGQPTVNALITSDTEPAGEPLTLSALGTAGSFTGAVATATGPPSADGQLQVHHGDVIEVNYQDTAPAATRTAQARADLLPPVLADVAAVTRFGRLQVTWSTDEPANAIVEFGETPALGQVTTNRLVSNTHRVQIDGLTPGQTVHYRVRSIDAAGNQGLADANGAPFQTQLSSVATVLLVDQFDDLILNDYLSVFTYTAALDEIGVDYEIWDVFLEGAAPTFEDLRNYAAVIWRNGEFFSSLGAAEIRAMLDYVNAGGGLFLASMELLSRLDEGGFDNFRRNVLHVADYDVDPGLGGIYGGESRSMTSGIDSALDFSEFPDLLIIPQDLSDTFRITTNAVPILFDSATGRTVGVRSPTHPTDPGGRVVFFSFPFDAIPAFEDPPNNRAEILRRVLTFLVPGITSDAALELDREEYTLPAVVTIDLIDNDLTGQPAVELEARTTQGSPSQNVTLLATSRPGRFRGAFQLVASTNVLIAGQVPANDGDEVEVTYADGQPAETLRVAATIDINPPGITGVTIEADYNEAIVEWVTSEPTDGLVKYRDVAFPSNFTVYHADFSDLHELRLVGLEPDHDYAVEIVCRDPAGNPAVDDNQGQFYRFRTRKPLNPPFSDTLEAGGDNWTAADSALDEETLSILASSTWELGNPNNELSSGAHSPNNCWGTNLRGEVNDYADTSLISPALLLSGGNRATLSFWHNYDFFPRSDDFDIVEIGGLYITTNNGAAWTPLRQYSEASDGWEEEQVDLSAHLGQVVRLGWAYGLFSFGSVQHPGWLIDDISVTVTSFVPGTLVLSNNLHQATVSVHGPLNRVERGLVTVITNAPPGEYLFEFGDVPSYFTPASQTHVMTEGATLVIPGLYTFSDTNGNGMSDPWEQQYFGAPRPGHLPTADFDMDGSSDRAEFLAGTNPTNALSNLRLVPPQLASSGDILLRWESSPGRGYRVHGSPNATQWNPLTDWLRATSSALSATVPHPTNGLPYLFRLEVQP